jgi:biopolymer transport protein ExbB/TolQ
MGSFFETVAQHWKGGGYGMYPMIGNVATLVGLLGTIIGLIQCFAGVAGVDASEKARVLSDGIAEAMNCTAFGLIVAIPSQCST